MEASTYLGLDVEDATATRARYLTYGHEGCSIEVSGELCMLDECAFVDESKELFARDKVVVFAMDFTRARKSCSVW